MTLLQKWKLARMERHLRSLERSEEFWRNEQRRLAFAAYDIPDMMNEPLRWGRLQNAANWAGYYVRDYQNRYNLQMTNIEDFRSTIGKDIIK